MHTLKKHLTYKTLALSGVFLALVLGLAATSLSTKTEAASSVDALHGYAWSSTIGWISLNCDEGGSTGGSVCATSNYGVSFPDPMGTRAFDGYAWSSNVGWISFKAADVTTQCGPVASMDSAGNMSGWARVLSGSVASGADGCISFASGATGPKYGVTVSISGITPVVGGVSLPGGPVTGYAWGSTNVGWIWFNYASYGGSTIPPSVDLKISEPSLGGAGVDGPVTYPAAGGTMSSKLSWTSTGVSACAAIAVYPGTPTSPVDWSGSIGTTSPGIGHVVQYPGTPGGAYGWRIDCSPITPGLPNVTDMVVINVGSTTLSPVVDFKATAIKGVGIVPSASVSAAAGDSVELSWTTQGITSPTCFGFASGVPAWTGTKTSSSGVLTTYKQTVTVPGDTYFKLSNCRPADGSPVGPDQYVHVAMGVMTTPPAVDLKASGSDGPISLPSTGGPVDLTWTAVKTTVCSSRTVTASGAPYADPVWTGMVFTTSDPYFGGPDRVTVPANTTTSMVPYIYRIVCTDGPTTYSDSVQVDVAAGTTGTTTTGGGTTGRLPLPWEEF
jgi:hypothetical protein